MNNKLIADIEMHRKRMRLLREFLPQIESLVKKSSVFTKEESIVALSKVKEYLVILKEEQKNGYVKAKEMRRKLYVLHEGCTHDVLIKKSNFYECSICGECFMLDDINFDSILVESLEESPFLYCIVSDIINEIAINDEDIFSVFEERLYDKYKNYDKNDNLLIYRRSR